MKSSLRSTLPSSHSRASRATPHPARLAGLARLSIALMALVSTASAEPSGTSDRVERSFPAPVFTFDHFQSQYYVYRSAQYLVGGSGYGPNELGWEGNYMEFNFYLGNKASLSGQLKLKLGVAAVGPQSSVVWVSAGQAGNLRFIGAIDVRQNTDIVIPRSAFRNGPNQVVLYAPYIQVGAGNPSGIVLNWLRLAQTLSL